MIAKIKHLFQRFFKECGMFFPDVKEFGFVIAWHRAVDFVLPRPKTEKYMNAMASYMDKELSQLTKKYNSGYIPEYPKEKKDMKGKIPVFVCWWQGEENMPPIVKACVKKIRKKIPNDKAELHFISFDNYPDYISLPEHILDKHQKGIISFAHLSDVLRFHLLSAYGGMWIDSTVFLSDDFEFYFLEREFYTQKFLSNEKCPHEACMGKWCGFFLYGRPQLQLFEFVRDSLVFWWEKHNKAVDYVFFDYIIRTGYNSLSEIRGAIDSVEPNNENIWLLSQRMNDVYSDEEYKKIIKSNGFFKLAHSSKFKEKDDTEKKTFYGHIISEG